MLDALALLGEFRGTDSDPRVRMPNGESSDLDETSQFEHDETRSPFDRVYRGILRAIYEEAIIPGQRLAAPDLMRQFDVGRGTIREVLHRLASGGVVSIVPNRGAHVRLLSRSEVEALLDIVEVLLGLAARGAAEAMREGKTVGVLRDHHRKLQPPTSFIDFTQFTQAREAYYRCIVGLSGNVELQRLFPAAQVHIMRVQLRRFQNAADSIALSDYAALTDAILSGNAVRAEKAGRDHVGYTRARIAELPDRAFAREGG